MSNANCLKAGNLKSGIAAIPYTNIFLNEPLANGKNPPTICRCKGALTQHLLAQREYSNGQSTCKCQPVRYFSSWGSICCFLLDENSKLVKIQTIIYQNSTLFSDEYTILENMVEDPLHTRSCLLRHPYFLVKKSGHKET